MTPITITEYLANVAILTDLMFINIRLLFDLIMTHTALIVFLAVAIIGVGISYALELMLMGVKLASEVEGETLIDLTTSPDVEQSLAAHIGLMFRRKQMIAQADAEEIRLLKADFYQEIAEEESWQNASRRAIADKRGLRVEDMEQWEEADDIDQTLIHHSGVIRL